MKREGPIESDAIPMLVVAAVLRGSGDRILVQQRPEGRPMAALWEFPGGKVDPGEAPEIALARELREELGIEIGPADLAPLAFSTGIVGPRPLILLLYDCAGWRGEPRPLHAAAIRWVSIDELATLAMPPADRPLVAMLARAQRGGER